MGKQNQTELEKYQEDYEGFQKQLAETLQQLETRPEDQNLLSLKAELEEAVEAYGEIIADLVAQATPGPPTVTAPPTEQPKWSVENHPAFQDRAPPQPAVAAQAPAHIFKVNEKVHARWKRQFVPGRILSITGSAKDPTFYVQYEGYSETASLKTDDLKPISVPVNPADAKKRKADDTPAYTTASTPFLSAEADIDPDLAEKAKREPSKVSDGPTRPAKIPKKTKNTKHLEAAKSKWQSFSAGKVGKQTKKKESMFKTGEGVNARVGFTNSGHEMRKDAPRTRHVYKPENGKEEEEY